MEAIVENENAGSDNWRKRDEPSPVLPNKLPLVCDPGWADAKDKFAEFANKPPVACGAGPVNTEEPFAVVLKRPRGCWGGWEKCDTRLLCRPLDACCGGAVVALAVRNEEASP